MSIDGGLRGLFHENIRAHWQAVETGGTGLGVPDSNFCRDGQEGWVEFKLTDGWRAGLSPEQIGWHDRRYRAGGRTFIAVRRTCDAGPRRGPACDELWLFRGDQVKALADHPLNEVEPLARMSGGPRNWDWQKIAFFFFGDGA